MEVVSAAVEVAEEEWEVVMGDKEDTEAKEAMVAVKAMEAKEVMVVDKVDMVVVLEEDTEMEDTVVAKEDMVAEANNMATKHLSPIGPSSSLRNQIR